MRQFPKQYCPSNTTKWLTAIAAGLALGQLPLTLPLVAQAQDTTTAKKSDLTPLAQWSRTTRKMRSAEKHFPGGLGGVPTDEQVFSTLPRFRVTRAAPGERPSQVLLTEYLPPIAAQGNQQSCVGWSTAYYTYSYGVAKQRHLTPEQQKEDRFQFSPAYIYNSINEGKDNGSQIGRAFQLLLSQGVATLAETPYNEGDYLTKPNDTANNRASRYRARRIANLFKGRSFYWGGMPADTEKLKTFLASARLPFVMAIPIFKDFPTSEIKDKNYVYNLSIEPQKDNYYGSHAVCCMGYDDNLKAFRIVNSWGPYWGDHGFIWLSEEFVGKWAREGWAIAEPGGPIARDARGKILKPDLGKWVKVDAPIAKPAKVKKTPAVINKSR